MGCGELPWYRVAANGAANELNVTHSILREARGGAGRIASQSFGNKSAVIAVLVVPLSVTVDVTLVVGSRPREGAALGFNVRRFPELHRVERFRKTRSVSATIRPRPPCQWPGVGRPDR